MFVTIPISPGELFDKLSILDIKLAKLTDQTQLEHVRHELKMLEEASTRSITTVPKKLVILIQKLRTVNLKLWQIEDEIRECEQKGDFGQKFIDLARAVYHSNDLRSDIKRQVNRLLNSSIIEEKLYTEYEKVNI